MNIDFHSDPLAREELIVRYLCHRLDADATERLETHYFQCDECFAELRASQALRNGLERSLIVYRREGDVCVVAFAGPTHLTRQSTASRELLDGILQQNDSKVLIDLSLVSRIDSAGLGLLLNCYSHALRNRRVLKVLHPNSQIRKMLEVTRINEVLESYDEESRALRSFSNDQGSAT
jgi:anti-sigma B factor antagonist